MLPTEECDCDDFKSNSMNKSGTNIKNFYLCGKVFFTLFTCPEFKELKCRVDSIIMTMVDFKDKVKKSEDLIRAENIIHERTLSF